MKRVFRVVAVCGWMLVTVAAAFGAEAALPQGVGREVRSCAACHPAQSKPHVATSMAHAAESVAECGVLRSHPRLKFASAAFSYEIDRKGDESNYTVSDGKSTLTFPIKWALGLGSAGQTYVFESGGSYYESFVSYYKAIDGLDITMGDQNIRPASLLEAAGRRLASPETAACLGCHTTNALSNGKLAAENLIPGLQCERCHGDTTNHLAGLKTGDTKLFAMKKLGALSAEDTSQFCGQCHRTWETIAMNGPHGVLNVRFQPYRLANSKCFDVDDQRIKCTSCHNPHVEIDRIASDYDGNCKACHATTGGKAGAKVCKVASRDCASCHMPKIELPGAHHAFTDHAIRVVKEKSVYPD